MMSPEEIEARLRSLGLDAATADIRIEPRCIDPLRADRPLLSQDWDLTADELFRLAINVVELERRRGYR
jgi:hypothetical protein